PFLDVFARYESLKISLHTSGPLMEWLAEKHPEYVDRLAELVAQGRVEIIGGAFYEPILGMLPSRDRIGQIRDYTRWLENRLDAKVRGMWTPERVWEQSFTRDVVDAQIEYTVLDDFHFKNAGLTDEQLTGHYVTEDDGRVLSVFPGSEMLRYLIPFGTTERIVEHLAGIAEQNTGAVVVFGDDGEKFGTWPETHKHVYDDGWLERFFDALVENQDWIKTVVLAEAIDEVPPLGKTYLPDSSYREMTEWSLPTERLVEYENLVHEMHDQPHWDALRGFIRGGIWRNFRVKYPESNEMYSRMMAVSRRVAELSEAAGQGASGLRGEAIDAGLLERARNELYRGQCNCSYWHGAFGGIYLPHLRNAVYQHLINADNLLEQAAGRHVSAGNPSQGSTDSEQTWVEAAADDFDFDGHREVRLSNDKLVAMIAPARGGQIYELDIRSISHNLLATLTRQPEAYHQKVLRGPSDDGNDCASIHDRVVFKQEGLDKMVQYDGYQRKSLVDLFYDDDATLEAVAAGTAARHGDFAEADYDARVRRNPGRIQIQLSREGNVQGAEIKITKGLTLDAGNSTLQIAYLLEHLPKDHTFHFASEFNFAGLPAGADNRYFRDADGNKIGQLGTRLDLRDTTALGLSDEWLEVAVDLQASRPTNFWTFPIETVSQSEGGFELIHQSVVVLPHWHVRANEKGEWGVTIKLDINTNNSEQHAQDPAVAAVK
ncbi:MAG: alpha-amylase/4-alpha-glucanotransferase domain-containing protein, partial [Planctomycetota bacterium]|nr:alpha-amylase/4-alpha-glucanotransferase domain-containing protein [Planctomycetota bacterium]